jgi:uncharacterized protein with von Willebrand factor type A (vWA) domain
MTDRNAASAGEGGAGGPAERSGSPAGPLAAEGGGVPDVVEARDRVREALVAFARSLRRAGAEVPANAAAEAARALVEAGFEEEPARAALRATLVSRRADLPEFERQFPAFWRAIQAGLTGVEADDAPTQSPEDGLAPLGGSQPGGDPGEAADGDGDDDAVGTAERTVRGDAAPEDDRDEDDRPVTAAVYSRTGSPEPVSVPATVLREDGLAGPMRELTRAIADLPGRRWVGDGDRRVDVRRALRESFGTGGAVASVPRRDRKRTAVRATLLVDVSQSVLDTVDRGFLLGTLHRAVAAWRDVRVFFFDEGLREVTDAFDGATAAGAVRELERAETEWGGGTRIGDALGSLRTGYPDAVDRETVTIVVSDGLETGDVDDLAANAAWLARQSATVLWGNPLAGSPEYEPTARGMAAALPYVDGLFAFAGPDDLAEMARQLRLRGAGGSIGYEHDPRQRGADTGDDADQTDNREEQS